ncbi:hypothetical protein BKA93DRAFT_868238 [Sparassis latifolia]
MPVRPRTADYIPLAQFPFQPAAAAHRTVSFCLRRRLLLAAICAASLFSLFLILSYTLKDVDADDDIEVILFPPDNSSASQTAYLSFQASPFALPNNTSLRQVHGILASSCLDRFFVAGEPCFESKPPPIDLVWTWVNGSDPLLVQAKELAIESYASDDPYRPKSTTAQDRQFRDHDELRHSLRSALAHFRPYSQRFHILTADFPIPAVEPNFTLSAAWRLGQVPQWLDVDSSTKHSWRDGNVELAIAHHAEIFSPYVGTNFNSLAIESQLMHLEDVSENFIYMNDDLYFAKPVTPTTFYTPAFGTVLHLQSELLVMPSPPTKTAQGEWRSMGTTNVLLSTRFGRRGRPYVAHEAKSVSAPLLHEIAQIWPGALADAASHRFRETRGGTGDVYVLFLATHFVVERAREALLWAWVVGRVGGLYGEWGPLQRRQAWEELGGEWLGDVEMAAEQGRGRDGRARIDVSAGRRETVEPERVKRVLRASGLNGVGQTRYIFSSLDGYAYGTLGTKGAPKFPSFSPSLRESSLPRCTLLYSECFALEGADSPSTVFTNIAFRFPQCGDCVITALVHASGTLGLSAFLPDPARVLPSTSSTSPQPPRDPVAHLPLVANWEDGNFALGAVMRTSGSAAGASVRAWTLQLLARYRYVIGGTPSVFERLSSPAQARAVLTRVERDANAALLCINDDVGMNDAEVGRVLNEWQARMWPARANWERT